MALGTTNGLINAGLVYNPNASIAADYMQPAYGTNVGTSITTTGSYPYNIQSIGVTTDATKSGLIARLSGVTLGTVSSMKLGYYYIRY